MEILKKILVDKLSRRRLINEFQELVWNNEESSEILRELAYYLDFYEANETLRKEDPNYYGDERLEEEIKLVVQKLEGSESGK